MSRHSFNKLKLRSRTCQETEFENGPAFPIFNPVRERQRGCALSALGAFIAESGPSVVYGGIPGMEVVMDHGWIITFAADASTNPQVSIATEGGSGTSVPDLSIEVDNLDQIYQRALEAHLAIEYPLTIEPWGVRRFFVKDPFGRLVNILAHE